METRTVPTSAVHEIAGVLRSGGLVALPTETVYGLAARAADRDAVERIFRVKGRPGDNPVIVHVATAAAGFELGSEIPGYAHALARRFWPGPLTLVFRSAVEWPWVQAGHPTIAVRVPEPEYLREVIRLAGPLAAPSANLSGRPSPTTAAHCVADLAGRIPLVVDGGPSPGGLESTVVDCTGPRPRILRPGPVTAEMIRDAGDAGSGGAASPGTVHPHYRPRARVIVVDDPESVEDTKAMIVASSPGTGAHRRVFGSTEELARNLYAWFREADAAGLSVIYVQAVPETGLGAAVMNRLRKAAGPEA